MTSSRLLGAFLLSLLLHAGDTGAVAPQLPKRLARALDGPQPAADALAQHVWRKDYRRRLRPFVSDPKWRQRLVRLILAEARRAEIPPGLVFAIIQVESAFERFALSPEGARGLMQVMPFWQEEIGRKSDNLFRPRVNLRYGCLILRDYLEQENGDMLEALAAYHGSRGQLHYPRRVYRAYRRRWAEPH